MYMCTVRVHVVKPISLSLSVCVFAFQLDGACAFVCMYMSLSMCDCVSFSPCLQGHLKVVKYLVEHVTQFPSDSELTRFISNITDKVHTITGIAHPETLILVLV